jgi:hypothetical protein
MGKPDSNGVNGTHGLNGHGPAPLPPSADGTAPAGKDPATGRFVAGNKCGQGNPHYRRLAANRSAFLEAVGPEQVKALAVRLLAQALAGNVDAARLVLAYAVGRPQPAADPDGADADEWRLHSEGPLFADVLAEAGKIVFREALDIVRRLQQEAEPVPLSLDGVSPDAGAGAGAGGA